jgi:hypothetical protein
LGIQYLSYIVITMSWSMMGRDLEDYWIERQASFDERRRMRAIGAAASAEQNHKTEGLPDSTTGDAKKGAGLFKVSIYCISI